MALTDINSEDRLAQRTFTDHLRDRLGWESVYAYNAETFGPQGTLGHASERDAVLVRDLRAELAHLNRFLAVRELKIQGARVPHYNRRADLVCFVNGLPLVFVELKRCRDTPHHVAALSVLHGAERDDGQLEGCSPLDCPADVYGNDSVVVRDL
jgi:hypothetical protein